MPIAVLALAFAAAASPPPISHHFSRLFVSPMGEPFRASPGLDALETWFKQADRNHDGILTLDEMQADAERFFATLDTNHDGEIDPDEITHYEVDIAPAGRAGLFDLPEPVVAADTDFNRGVSLDEFRRAAVKRFQALDVERRGQLTIAALESLRPPPRARQQDDNDIPPGHLEPEIDPGG